MSGNHAIANATTVVVIGASGFIGEHLLGALVARKDLEIRVLVHRNRAKPHARVNFIEGDLLKPDSLDALLSKNCTVINLAYLIRDNLEAMTNLAIACAKNQVRRLIHCSTAVVVGSAKNNWITENTQCVPISAYQQTKLQIENTLLEMALGEFEVTIIRPTAVFGPRGKNLLKLANELMTASMWINYIRSCLFNRRSMNLVCIENVVAALVFLLDAEQIDQEIFIISDDDALINNYRDIENRLLASFRKTYAIPRLYVPEFVLRGVLGLVGKSNKNPTMKFSDQKLVSWGFKKPQHLEACLDTFAIWYKNSDNIKDMRI